MLRWLQGYVKGHYVVVVATEEANTLLRLQVYWCRLRTTMFHVVATNVG